MWHAPCHQSGSALAGTGCEWLMAESPIEVVADEPSVNTAHVQNGVSWLTQMAITW